MAGIPPFDPELHCTLGLQATVGLGEPHIGRPRNGEGVVTGRSRPDCIAAQGFPPRMARNEAEALWNAVDQNTKDNPGDPLLAVALGKVATIAGIEVPQSIRDNIGTADPDSLRCDYVTAIGNTLLADKTTCLKFITYYYVNTTDEHRVLWKDLKGIEQHEWVKAWIAAGKTHDRDPIHTVGLRGTDINALTTRAQITGAMRNSPSLRARGRPQGHPLDDAAWNESRDAIVLFP